MRAGVTLAVLRNEVLIESGNSTAAGHTAQLTERINHLLNRMERQIARRPGWKVLEAEVEVIVPANSAFGTLPTEFEFSRVSSVWTNYGSDWLPVTYGIGICERSLYDDGQRASPIQRWEIQYPGTTTFEVWPISASAETLRFTGRRSVGVMTTDSDVCVLDGDALVLLTAGEMLAKSDPETAQTKLAAANRIIVDELNGERSTDEGANLAGRMGMRLRPGIDYIPSGWDD